MYTNSKKKPLLFRANLGQFVVTVLVIKIGKLIDISVYNLFWQISAIIWW